MRALLAIDLDVFEERAPRLGAGGEVLVVNAAQRQVSWVSVPRRQTNQGAGNAARIRSRTPVAQRSPIYTTSRSGATPLLVTPRLHTVEHT